MVNIGPLTPEITRLMFTHPKSILRVLRMLMHFCVGHVNLLPGEFHLSKFSSVGLRTLCPKFLVRREICTMVSTRPNCKMPFQNFGGTPQKNFRNQKYAKFSPISDDFKVWRQISPKWIKIFKIRSIFDLPRFLLR